jgi:hypothetical protein
MPEGNKVLSGWSAKNGYYALGSVDVITLSIYLSHINLFRPTDERNSEIDCPGRPIFAFASDDQFERLSADQPVELCHPWRSLKART